LKVIVVGGGAAGLTISRRLTSKFDVSVMERSALKRIPFFYRIPLLIGYLFKKNNIFLSTVLIDGPNKRKVPFFVSRVLGGASVINGTVHAVGSDWLWKKVLNKYDYTWEELKESYNDIFQNQHNSIKLKKNKPDALDKIFLKVLSKKGIPNFDVEFADKVAAGSLTNTSGKFLRSSVQDFVNNLNISLGHKVDHILTDGSKVIGIECNGEKIFSDYVILSSGVLGSNEIIKNGFKDVNTQELVYLDNPGLGKISDHTNLRVNVKTKVDFESLNQISTKFSKKIALFCKHFMGLSTLLSGTGATSAAHLDLDADGNVDVRIQLLRFYESGRAGSEGAFFDSDLPGFSISITVINPKSTGYIDYSGEEARPDPQYLNIPLDVETLKNALNFVINMLQDEDFSNIIDEVIDLDEIVSDPEVYIRKNVYSGYHLIGGLSDIVDQNFKVNGFEKLYICDASVLESYPSSNIHAPVVLLADLFAKRFLTNEIFLR